jgi:serine/threonine protein kinase
MALAPRTRLGAYEILTLIGVGGMGEVYRAHDTRLGRDVAIKVLPAEWAADRERLARFERESRTLASLNHPNIAAIYGVEESGAVKALVLELVEGETLAARISKSTRLKPEGMPVAEVVVIGRQIADALDAAHERGIVHRDLKPANITLTPGGVVKVLDFGLATTNSAGPSEDFTHSPTMLNVTRRSVLLGTAPYMSPEQARGKPVDKRTDVWALGCVLYEMLTGTAAFSGETTTDVLATILHSDPDWLALPASTPPGMVRLVKRCLEKDLKRRIRDVGDVSAELEESERETPPPLAARSSSRAMTRIALAAAVVGAIGVWAFSRSGAGGSGNPPRLLRATRVTNSAAQEFGPAISPDGKWVAYYSNARGPTDVWVKFRDNGSTLNLTASLGLELQVRAGLGGIDIAPDGTRIAFAAREGAPVVYSTWIVSAPVGGPPVKLLQNLQAMRWSPDGKSLVAIQAGSTRGDAVIVANADGSGLHEIVQSRGGRHIHWPAWSADSRYIFFIYTYDTWHTEPSELYRVAATGGALEPVVQTVRRALYPAPMADGSMIYGANPDTTDLALWWRSARGDVQSLTTDVGEHTESRLSADGQHLVCTLLEMKQSLVDMSVGGSPPTTRALTDGYGSDLDPSFSPIGDRIVFSSMRAGNRNLWTMARDGSGLTPLTSGAAIDERPAFSADGQQIAFVSDRGGRRGIWVISASGGAPRSLGPAVVLDTLTWSTDGTRVLFSTPNGDLPQPATMNVADGTITLLNLTAGGFSARFSPKGDRIAYFKPDPSHPPRLAFADRSGAPLFPKLPTDVGFGNAFLAWSPDGRRVAAVSMAANANAQIWIVDPESSTPFQKLVELPPGVRMRGITWAPDGSNIVFAKQEPQTDIVLYDLKR